MSRRPWPFGASLFGASLLGVGLVACGRPPEPIEPAAPAGPAPEALVAPRAGPDRSSLPEPGPRPEWAPPEPVTFRLSNGIRVWHIERGTVPLCSLELIVPRGSATDPPAKAGLTQLTVDMLDEGAGSYGALSLSEELGRLATDYRADVDVDYVGLSMNLLTENFEASVALLADMVRRPTFAPAEFARRKEQHLAQALSAESEPSHGRRVLLYRALFGEGYAGNLPSGTGATLQRVTLADVKAHFSRLVAADGAELVVVGSIDRERVERGLQKSFGDWTGKPSASVAAVAAPRGQPSVHFVPFPGAAQSALGVVRRGPTASSETYFGEEVYNRSLGGAFTSRINLNLRESKGFTYGAFSMFRRFRNAGLYGVFTDVRTDTTRASIDEIFAEFSSVCESRPLTPKERDDAVNGLLLGFPADFESIGDVAGRIATLPIYSRPAQWYKLWPQRVETVTAEVANLVGREYCDPGEYDIVIAGDREKVEPAVASLGRPLLVYDAQGRLQK